MLVASDNIVVTGDDEGEIKVSMPELSYLCMHYCNDFVSACMRSTFV